MLNEAAETPLATSHRLFLGIEVPLPVQTGLAALRADIRGARWQWPADMHLTLRFLGSLPADRQAAISQAMGGVSCHPFSLQVAGVGTFSGRVLWAAVTPNPALVQLRDRIDAQLAGQQQTAPEEKSFVPHVTLARMARSAQVEVDAFLTRYAELQMPPWTVEHFSLFSSEPSGNGPMYRVLERYPLTPWAA